jgi:hypothetical protein
MLLFMWFRTYGRDVLHVPYYTPLARGNPAYFDSVLVTVGCQGLKCSIGPTCVIPSVLAERWLGVGNLQDDVPGDASDSGPMSYGERDDIVHDGLLQDLVYAA